MKAKSKINKTVYSPAGIIIRLAELGLDEDEIMYSLDLPKPKFDELKKKKNISSALADCEPSRARKVEQALYQRAVGFEYEETVNALTQPSSTPRSDKSVLLPYTKGGNKEGLPARKSAGSSKSSAKSTIKTVIPDVTACIFWLKNRQPDKWLDPKDVPDENDLLIKALEEIDETETDS